MGISVCIIARDEEASLPECVKSVQSIADEVIVVDTGSTDATVAIARRMGCQVFSFPWNDDFAAARNYALEQAHEEWILSIDCDERLRNPEVVRRTLQAVSPKVDALLVRCISPAEHGSTSIALVARLFRRHQEIRFRGRIHEQVARLNGELRIAQSEIELWHEGYARGEGILRAEHERNLRLLQQALSEEPGNAYLWLQYARSALVLQRLTEASQALQQALQMSSPESLLYWQIRCWQAQVALSLRAPREALRYSHEVLQRYPGQTFAASIAAEAYVMLQEWYHAATFYEQWPVWQEQPTTESLLIGHLRLSPAELAFRLGRCYVGLGRWEEAERLLREGLESETDHLPCRLLLTELLITRGRLAEADSFLQDLRHRQVPSHLLEELLRHRHRRERTTLTLSRPLLSLSNRPERSRTTCPLLGISLRGVVDEIVVVDTGSSDTTIEVAQSYGARVYSFPWNDSFAAARNESLRHCTGEWILYLDADEQLHPASLNILLDFLCDLPDDVGGVACTIESPHRRADGTIELHWSAYPRIFRNYGYPPIHFHGRVHEQISPSILALGKQIIRSPLRILHSGYDQSPEVLQAKAYRNYRLLMLQV
ncbi:MAG: glycosyltransferase [Bacteroidota bacterium]|nr:glycosyltransferase [Bacteroidota bacterium]